MTLLVPSRFNGPPRSGNGGWCAGALAAHLDPEVTVRVRLTSPPPLEVPLEVSLADGTATCAFGTATLVDASPEPVPAVSLVEARAAETAYVGLRHHPFPTCFVCGPEREPGDGLRIFPGAVGDQTVAATWTPYPSMAGGPVTWAAVDCAGGWAGEIGSRPMVLGQITARVLRAPSVGEPYVVVGRRGATEGRRTATAASLYDVDGDLLATAEHVWISVDPVTFNTL